MGRYITAYDGVYDFSGMTQAEIEALIEEELFADLYAGIDNTGRDALREDARRGYAQAQTEQGQNTKANENSHPKPSDTRLQSDSDIEEENINDGTAAVQKLMEQSKTSDDPEGLIVKNAMYRSDLGPIDFRWGTPGRGSKFKGGYGLAHIIAKRNAGNGRGVETVNSIVEAIAKAETSDRQYSDNLSNDHYRIRLYYGNTTVVLDKTPGSNHWLLTGWENNETATNAAGEVHDSADATAITPTRTRRNGDATVSNDSIRDSAGNSNTQNGRGSVEVPGADPRRELARLQREYRDATERADPDYDYEGQYARIKELQRQAEAGETAPSSAPDGAPSPQGEGYPDSHPERGEIGKRKKEYKAKCLERISPSQAFIFTHPAYSRRR